MARRDIASWFAQQHGALLRAYVDAAGDEQCFPGFASLPPSPLRRVMKREPLGLASFLAVDPDGLTEATDIHREQAEILTHDIPVEEQLDLLDRRITVGRDLLDRTDEDLENREGVLYRLDEAGRYSKVNTRSIELGRRLGDLSD